MTLCHYTRRGALIVGECRELNLRTEPYLGRDECEAALVKMCEARLGRDPDRCYRHEATVEVPPLPVMELSPAEAEGLRRVMESNDPPTQALVDFLNG